MRLYLDTADILDIADGSDPEGIAELRFRVRLGKRLRGQLCRSEHAVVERRVVPPTRFEE